jgi:hypothetical protein
MNLLQEKGTDRRPLYFCTYLRTNLANIEIPTTSDKIKLVFNEMEKFTDLRDVVIKNIKYLHHANSESLSLNSTFATFSVYNLS